MVSLNNNMINQSIKGITTTTTTYQMKSGKPGFAEGRLYADLTTMSMK